MMKLWKKPQKEINCTVYFKKLCIFVHEGNFHGARNEEETFSRKEKSLFSKKTF